jgi:hypothetical protein
MHDRPPLFFVCRAREFLGNQTVLNLPVMPVTYEMSFEYHGYHGYHSIIWYPWDPVSPKKGITHEIDGITGITSFCCHITASRQKVRVGLVAGQHRPNKSNRTLQVDLVGGHIYDECSSKHMMTKCSSKQINPYTAGWFVWRSNLVSLLLSPVDRIYGDLGNDALVLRWASELISTLFLHSHMLGLDSIWGYLIRNNGRYRRNLHSRRWWLVTASVWQSTALSRCLNPLGDCVCKQTNKDPA